MGDAYGWLIETLSVLIFACALVFTIPYLPSICGEGIPEPALFDRTSRVAGVIALVTWLSLVRSDSKLIRTASYVVRSIILLVWAGAITFVLTTRYETGC